MSCVHHYSTQDSLMALNLSPRFTYSALHFSSPTPLKAQKSLILNTYVLFLLCLYGFAFSRMLHKWFGLVTKSHPSLATLWTVIHQVPLSMGFSRQEYLSGLHILLQGFFLTQGSNLCLLHCRQILYWLRYQGSPLHKWNHTIWFLFQPGFFHLATCI